MMMYKKIVKVTPKKAWYMDMIGHIFVCDCIWNDYYGVATRYRYLFKDDVVPATKEEYETFMKYGIEMIPRNMFEI